MNQQLSLFEPIRKSPELESVELDCSSRMATNTPSRNVPDKQIVFEYILDSIAPDVHEEKEFKSDYDKIMFINQVFESDFWDTHAVFFKNDRKLTFSEWLSGLPSSLDIEFESYRIVEYGIEWGCLPENPTEDQEDNWIEGWYKLMADHFFLLLDDIKKKAPLSTQAIEIMKKVAVQGSVAILPPDKLERKLYLEVKNKLELIGGKWKGGKVGGFVFEEDPTETLEALAIGESINLKKEFQFFATPDSLADRLVALANIQPYDRILEPSAGQGAIVKSILRAGAEKVYGFELMPLNQKYLSKIPEFELLGDNFLLGRVDPFDVVIANPPFSKNQDIDHVMKMYESLKPGGRMVSIMSTHWQHSSGRKEAEFKKWIDTLGAEFIQVDAGEFKSSGTMIATVIIKLIKEKR